ncbi:MAG: class I SAM-dependent methyltransferase, partial [Alphaproteobacteria bacterium]|nr:class I SAM-dependent methyltransferase [Alphaproteobacteria bacterium]
MRRLRSGVGRKIENAAATPAETRNRILPGGRKRRRRPGQGHPRRDGEAPDRRARDLRRIDPGEKPGYLLSRSRRRGDEGPRPRRGLPENGQARMNDETPHYEGRDLEALSGMSHYYDWIVEYFSPHLRGAVIEYGPGSGIISARLRPLAKSLELVEPSPNLAAMLREKFAADAAVSIREQALESHIAALADGSRDCAVLVNVLEHLEDDRAALAHLFRVLRPGGTLLLFVPALPFLFSRLDAFYGHYRRYRRDALADLVRGAGFEVSLARYMDLIGVLPWWLFNTLGGATAFNPALVRIYNRFFVRLTRF